jgi:hypothetical protein
VNFPAILIWGYELATAKNKTCIDCLHCKVSAKSTADKRLCFCVKEEKEARRREAFWLEKKVCGKFFCMGSRVTLRAFRRPLLKKQTQEPACAGEFHGGGGYT